MQSVRSTIKRIIPKRTRVWLRETQHVLRGTGPRLLSWPLRSLIRNPDDVIQYVFESMPCTPELMIRGYHQGLFPKPDPFTGAMRFHDPDPRGVVPVIDYHIPKRLKSIVNQERFEIRVNHDYKSTIEACGDRDTTWISAEIIDTYLELHRMGVAHSVEAWQEDELVGGLIGMAFGGYFVTESLFYNVSQASKVAFVHLMEILKESGFVLHDVQWPTQLFLQFGGFGQPRSEFKKDLAAALITPATFSHKISEAQTELTVK